MTVSDHETRCNYSFINDWQNYLTFIYSYKYSIMSKHTSDKIISYSRIISTFHIYLIFLIILWGTVWVEIMKCILGSNLKITLLQYKFSLVCVVLFPCLEKEGYIFVLVCSTLGRFSNLVSLLVFKSRDIRN